MVRLLATIGIADAAPEPTGDLPIAAGPAMLAHSIGVIVSRIVVQKLDIADQGRARKDRFKQIVTEQRVFRNASVQRFFERVDIVQTLARIDSLAEEILIDIRRGGGIRINAGVAREDAREQRLRGTLQRDAHSWLQNRVTFNNRPGRAIETRLVQGMNRRANQTTSGIARQLGVSIQRNDITNLRKQIG